MGSRDGSIEVPDKQVDNFKEKYGDNKTHLHNTKDLQLDQLNFIGFGTFSCVKKGFSNKYKQDVAVKIVDLRDKRNKLYVSKYLHNEIQLWKELSSDNHDNILTMKEYISTNRYSYIVTDAISCGDLEKFILRRSLDEVSAKRFAKDLVAGLAYCHGKGIAHRDIKPENILVADNMMLKLADFTFATKKNPVSGGQCGTQSMLAPEQHSRKPHNPFASDIWQLGLTFYIMLFKDMPYKKQRRKHILKEMKDLVHHHKGVPLPHDVSIECKDLLAAMLNLDPTTRYVAEQVKASSWFS